MSNNNDGNQIMQAPSKVKVTAKDFAAKYKSKREIYNFISVDCGIYLPAHGLYIQQYFLMISFFIFRTSFNIFFERYC